MHSSARSAFGTSPLDSVPSMRSRPGICWMPGSRCIGIRSSWRMAGMKPPIFWRGLGPSTWGEQIEYPETGAVDSTAEQNRGGLLGAGSRADRREVDRRTGHSSRLELVHRRGVVAAAAPRDASRSAARPYGRAWPCRRRRPHRRPCRDSTISRSPTPTASGCETSALARSSWGSRVRLARGSISASRPTAGASIVCWSSVSKPPTNAHGGSSRTKCRTICRPTASFSNPAPLSIPRAPGEARPVASKCSFTAAGGG